MIQDIIKDKVIFCSGGCGSFGKAFIKDVLQYNPKKIIIYSRDEYKHSQFEEEMKDKHDDQLRFILGDVRDRDSLVRVMSGVDYVIHTAALKRVERGTYNPEEFIKTNIDGTKNIISASIQNGVKKTILLSTDKSVNPQTLYGSTKHIGEQLFQASHIYSKDHSAKFAICRYGNVINSRGSVIPTFKEYKKNGYTELTITDENMTRFVITMKQAIELVYNCLENMQGGEIFIPKIPSIKIVDLAKAFDMPYKITGVRAYEKLHEQLIDKMDICYEYDDKYILYPNYQYYKLEEKVLTNGKRVSVNYTSDSNNFLTIDQIKELINES